MASLVGRLPQLRVAVNSRCGRACFYCRPSGEGISTHAGAELNIDELLNVARTFTALGISRIKLTGGDPALWLPLVSAASRLKDEAGTTHLEVISRHPNIGILAGSLSKSGVDLLNISLDTLRPELHREITGVNDLPHLLHAIEACVGAGLKVKLNMVVMKGVNDTELDQIVNFCEMRGVSELKFLDVIEDLEDGTENYRHRLQRLGRGSLRDLYIQLGPIVDPYRARATETQVLFQGDLGHPMLGIQMPSGLKLIVKDHHTGAWYGSMCNGCRFYPCHDALMAIRLTADGRLQFCLLRENVAVDLKPHLTRGGDGLLEVVRAALTVYQDAEFHGSQNKTEMVEAASASPVAVLFEEPQ